MIVLSFNVKEKVKNFYLDLLIETIEQRPKPERQNEYNNYYFKSKYTNELYDILIPLCKKHLNPFTIKSLKFGTWCCLSDKHFKIGLDQWHNHKKSGTIIAVLYFKIPDEEKHGIDFRFNDRVKLHKPKPFDLIIFPNYLDHRPYGSETDEKRISINLELQCKEKAEDIFYGI